MGTTEPGTIRLATIHQGQYWVNREGEEIALSDMDLGYLQNLIGYLHRIAGRLIDLEEKAAWANSLLPGNWDHDFDGPDIFSRLSWASPQAWVDHTELGTAIRKRIDELEKAAIPVLYADALPKLQQLVAELKEEQDRRYKGDWVLGHDAGRQYAGRELERLLETLHD